MSRTLRLTLAAVAVALAAGPAAAQPATTGKNLTLPYPAKAPLVVTVSGWQKATDRLTKMSAALPKAEAAQVKQALDKGLEQALDGRKTDAVPGDRRIYGVVHDFARLGDEEPAFAVLLPVTSYADFKRTFLTAAERGSVAKAGKGVESVDASVAGAEKKVYLADLKDYVVVSPSEEVARSYTTQYTKAQSGTMGPELSAGFLASDVAVFLNMDVVNDLYGEQIRQVKGLIDFALGQAEMSGMLPGLDKKQVELVKTMFTGLLQGVEDSQGLLVALEFRPAGLQLGLRTKFAADSPTANALKGEAPTPLADIGKLPTGLTIYGGSRFGKKISDTFRGFTQQFAAPDGQDGADAKITKLLDQVTAAGPGGEVSGGTGTDAALTVAQYKDAKKAAAGLVGVYQAVPAGGKVMGIVVKDKARVTDGAQEHGGFTFAEIKVAYDFAATVENLPEQVRESTLANLRRMAKEKMTYWIGTDGKAVATVVAPDWPAASKLLDGYLDPKSTIGTEAGFKTVRSNLPVEANAIYLAETGQTLTLLAEQAKVAMAAIPGGGPPIGKLRPVTGESTYLGFALTLKPQTAGIDVFVPGTAMNVAAKMLSGAFRRVE
jgi:hypothetical protein